jgi:hypothetical protein
MTQDQYGQAQDAGYGVRGDVAEDDEYEDDQGKPMTRFQKVASALRGDRPDRDEPDVPDEDQVAADEAGVTSPAANGSGVAAESDVMPSHEGTQPWPNHRDEGAVAASTDDPAGDYWDESQAPMTGQDQVVTVTNPDVPVTDAETDPLADPDEVSARTRPDIPNADLPVAEDPAGTEAGRYDTGAGAPAGTAVADDRSVVADDGTTVANDRSVVADDGSAVGGNGSVPGQAGAATISDVPVTPTAEDAAVTEAAGRTGRHAGGPAQELRPGEATDTLDDLGDLAYGNLLPDAADFTAQWQQIQFRFVDDPRASVTEAAEVVSQVTAKLEAAIQERQRAIQERQQAIQDRQRSLQDRWGEDSQADTETLRETLRMYRAFLDQLIGPKV